MPTEELLGERIAQLLEEGRLPREASERVLAGHGNGSVCDICGDPIESADVEYDVEWPVHANRILKLHLRCHAVWTKTLRGANNGER